MSSTLTAEHDVPTTPSAPDLAPVSAAQPMEKARDGVAAGPTATNDTPQGVFNLEGRKRKKTRGEVQFDWGTYGGVALLGNEAASLLITTQAEHGIGKNWHARQMEYFKSLKGKKFVPEYVHSGGLMNVLIALIGGMTMVPFVKYLEDHKGEIVRKADRAHYGDRVDSDPSIIEAHKEMDEAPKQTWGSLWKGRALTVVGAVVVDWLAGNDHAPSTKLFKNSPTFQKYASMDRIAAQASNGVMNALNIAEESRPTWNKWLKKGSWLLVLSGTLTVVFYVSSKLFASRRDQKIEQREEAPKHAPVLRDSDNNDLIIPETTLAADKPQAQVNSIMRDNMLVAAPTLAQSM